MRSCIYCGKELEKGEVCNCAQSVARRAAKEKNEGNNTGGNQTYTHSESTNEQTSYRTGYTKKESKFKQAWNRHKMKRTVNRSTVNPKGAVRNLLGIIKQFIMSPIESVINPPNIGKGMIMLLSALQGAVIWLCVYFIMNTVRRGPFAMIASLLVFNGTAGYKNLMNIAMALLSGAVSGIIIFFIYSGIFYAINRFIFRLNTRYWEFAQRIVLTGIPMAVIGIFGAVFGVFSSVTLAILMLCGAASLVILTYEALRTEWISQTPGKTMYAMMLGFLVFFSIICYLIRLS